MIYKINEASKKKRKKGKKMDAVKEKLSWKEKIIVKILAKTFKRVYNITRVEIVNKIMQ